MTITFEEVQMYKNFDELAKDVLDLAKEILPDQLFFLSSFTDTQQMILKLSSENSNMLVTEGMVLDLNNTLCNRIDFDKKQPLMYEDIQEESNLDGLKEVLDQANVRSYLGIPISFMDGEKFGTLCAINDEKSRFDKKSIDLLQRIVKMFSYYLVLERFAYRDTLTDLYNRRYLTKYFEEYSQGGGELFFLDLDGFKKVNDNHGHEAGDEVLKEVASRLQKFANEQREAFAVRLGGDEFLINFSQPSSRKEVSEKARQVLHLLSSWNTKYELSASIGIVRYPVGRNIDLDALLQQADEALYRAKTAGKNVFRFF